jgi:hypothetical protein
MSDFLKNEITRVLRLKGKSYEEIDSILEDLKNDQRKLMFFLLKLKE